MTAPLPRSAAVSLEAKLATLRARSRAAQPVVVPIVAPTVQQSEAGPGLMRCALHGVYRSRMKLGYLPGCPYCADDVRRHRTPEQAAEFARERLADGMDYVGLEGRFTAATLDNFTAVTAEQRVVVEACRRFARTAQEGTRAGLVLLGPCGTGKTHLLAAMARELAFERLVSARLTTPRAIVRRLRETWARGSKESEGDALAELTDGLDVLLLDEAGVGFGSDAELVQLFDVIDRRYALERPTVLASNLNAKSLRQALGDRIFDRLREGAQVLVLDWASHRGGA